MVNNHNRWFLSIVHHQYSVHPVFQRVTLHKLFEKYRFIVFFLKKLLTLHFHDVLKLEAKVTVPFYPTLRYMGGLLFLIHIFILVKYSILICLNLVKSWPRSSQIRCKGPIILWILVKTWPYFHVLSLFSYNLGIVV